MKLHLVKYFSGGNPYNFPKNDMNVWVSEEDLSIICEGADTSLGPVYVRIVSEKLICPFEMYAKIATTNPNTDMGNGTIWIPQELLPKEVYVEKNEEVDVSRVDLKDKLHADAITIKLPVGEVAKWSDDEVKSAERHYRKHNGIVYGNQRVFVNPITKDAVIASIDSIFPRSESNLEVYTVDKDTLVTFEGLPEERQKVIDFSQIGGLEHVVNRIREIIQIPLTYPEYITKFGIKPPKGMLLYGPPGNGKSMIARALAKTMGASFVEIDLTDALSKWVGGGERQLKEKFKEAERRNNGIIFIDEIDSLAQIRREDSEGHEITLVGTLLSLMDGINSTSKIFVIGATNRLNAIDPALRRPGRFDLEIEVPLPNLSAREDILSKYIKTEKQELYDDTINNHFIQGLAELTNGYSGADISSLYREAVMSAIRKNLSIDSETGKVSMAVSSEDIQLTDADFFSAMKAIVPTALRGLEVSHVSKSWDDLLLVDEEKKTIEQIHRNLELLSKDEALQMRPSFSNILITGKKGTGKHTFVSAFTRQFGYETVGIDFIYLESMDMVQAYQYIDSMFIKCRQISPSVLLLENLDKVQDTRKYSSKILNEIARINKHLRVLVICLSEIKSLKEELCEYKGFGSILDFDKSEDAVRDVVRKIYGDVEIPANCNIRIGELISIFQEQEILKKYL